MDVPRKAALSLAVNAAVRQILEARSISVKKLQKGSITKSSMVKKKAHPRNRGIVA